MQIHELNNFTDTLGAGSYLPVDNGTDTGKISTQQLLSATEARIDNIIAGDAPSAAEVTDARYGADGVTYTSLGTAIRTQVSDLKAEISNFETTYDRTNDIHYGTITTNVSVGTFVDITAINSNPAWGQIVIPMKVGEQVTLTGRGGDGARLWAWLDKDQKLLSKSDASVTASNLTLYAPEDGYFVMNCILNQTYALTYRKLTILDEIADLENKYANIESTDNKTNDTTKGYIATNVNVGTTVDINSITINDSWRTIVVPVKAGEWFSLTGRGGGGARLWALLDTASKLISKSEPDVSESDYTLSIKTDGYAVFNFASTVSYSLVHHKIVFLDELNSLMYTDMSDNWSSGYVTTNADVGNEIPFAYTYSGSYKTQIRRCRVGETYIVTARGGSSPRAWCVIDEDYKVVSVASADTYYENHIIEINNDGYLIVNALASGFKYSLHGKLIATTEDFANSVIPTLRETISEVEYSSLTNMTYDQIIAGYDALVSAFPTQITKSSLGADSSGQYTIYRYDFIPDMPDIYGNNQGIVESYTATDFPIIYMDACIHGGERPCARALLNFMHKVYTNNGNDIFGWLKDHIHFVIIPVANPYGYVNGIRKNGNGVDLNRNFVPFWIKGESDPTNEEYRGTSALSEVEAQYINAILNEIKDKNALYMSWHTHGNFTAYDKMTCYAFPFFIYSNTQQVIANDLINAITRSGHENHNLPANSGYIGIMQVANETGMSAYQGALYGIPSVCPEVMYKYYDGSIGVDYSNDVNCMNAEYVLLTITLMYKYFLN